MKELNDVILPDDLKYSQSHEWVRLDGGSVKIGITDYAQDQLGDIVFVELPEVGTVFQKGEEFGTVESVKAVSELYIPISGEITAVNTSLEDSPELVNNDPYNNGWMLELNPSDPAEMDTLLSNDAYLETLKGA